MKKKVVLLVLGLLCLLALPAWGAGEDIQLMINGTPVQPEQPPVLLEDRVYVPMRYVGEYLGAQVEYIAATEADSAHVRMVKKLGEGIVEQVTMYYGEHELAVRYTIDGEDYNLTQTAPQTMTLINGVSYVPLRTAGETLHCYVQWQGDTRTVTITEQTVEKAALLQTIKAQQKETSADDLAKDTDALKASADEAKDQAEKLKQEIEELENNQLVKDLQDKKDSGQLEEDKKQLEADKAKLEYWEQEFKRLQEELEK